jgi:hypothetical protein
MRPLLPVDLKLIETEEHCSNENINRAQLQLVLT